VLVTSFTRKRRGGTFGAIVFVAVLLAAGWFVTYDDVYSRAGDGSW